MKVVVGFVIQEIGGDRGDRWRCRRPFYVVPLNRGLRLHKWEVGDNPFIEHMRWNRNCEFLKQRLGEVVTEMSLVMRKPAFCICENKDADQLRGNREADQHLCFRYSDSMIPLLSKSKIPSI